MSTLEDHYNKMQGDYKAVELALQTMLYDKLTLVPTNGTLSQELNSYFLGFNGNRMSITSLEDILTLPKGANYSVDQNIVDQQYNYDFTHIVDHNNFSRGKKPYIRPCGWLRIGLNVLGKYKTDAWLTEDNSKGAWINSYYPTDLIKVKGYLQDNETKSSLDKLLKGFKDRVIVSMMDIKEAEKCSQEFDYQGTKYKFVIQNRVNPKGFSECCGSNVYLCSPDDIRPYGLLIKPVNPKPGSIPIVFNQRMHVKKIARPFSHLKRLNREEPKVKTKRTYGTYIYKVLKQVQPGCGISKRAMQIMESIISDMFEQFATEASRLVRKNKKSTLTSRDIQFAVKLLLPGELAKHGDIEGRKAISLSYKP